MAAFEFLFSFIHSRGELRSSGILWAPRTRFALDSYNKVFSGRDLDRFEKGFLGLFFLSLRI